MRLWKGLLMVLMLVCAHVALAGRTAQAGNAALMDAWKARQMELSRKIARRLFDKGGIPQNGTIQYTARVKPDASAPGGLVLGVDSLSVTPHGAADPKRLEGAAASQAMDLAFEPRDPALSVRLQNLDVPVGTEVKGTLVIKDGKPAEEPVALPPPAAAPPPPEEPSLWQKLMNTLGF